MRNRSDREWTSIEDFLKCRVIETQGSLDAAKNMMDRNNSYKFLHDYYLAQFYILNHLWMRSNFLTNPMRTVDELRSLLDQPADPAPDAYDPGRFMSYSEITIKSLIIEFESPIYR